MLQDPDRFWPALAAIPGAMLYGLYHFAVLMRSGRPVTLADYRDLLLNIACAVLCGVLLAFMLAKLFTGMIPWVTLRDPVTVGFILGALGWELLPIAFPKLAKSAQKAMDKMEGGDQ